MELAKRFYLKITVSQHIYPCPVCYISLLDTCPELINRGRGNRTTLNWLEFKGSGVKSKQLTCSFAHFPPGRHSRHVGTQVLVHPGHTEPFILYWL